MLWLQRPLSLQNYKVSNSYVIDRHSWLKRLTTVSFIRQSLSVFGLWGSPILSIRLPMLWLRSLSIMINNCTQQSSTIHSSRLTTVHHCYIKAQHPLSSCLVMGQVQVHYDFCSFGWATIHVYTQCIYVCTWCVCTFACGMWHFHILLQHPVSFWLLWQHTRV